MAGGFGITFFPYDTVQNKQQREIDSEINEIAEKICGDVGGAFCEIRAIPYPCPFHVGLLKQHGGNECEFSRSVAITEVDQCKETPQQLAGKNCPQCVV